MNKLSVDEFDLLGLFGSEPERQGLDESWLFDDSIYTYSQGSIKFTCAIHPFHKDVRLMLFDIDNCIYDYSAMSVHDILINENSLSIQISPSEIIFVTIKPDLKIKHGTSKQN